VTVTPAPRPFASWERLHPMSPLVRGGRTMTALLVFLAYTSIQRQSGESTHVVVELALVAVALVLGLVHWLVTRFSFDGETLHVETGLLRRDTRKVPVARIQAVDIVQPYLAKVLDIAELKIRVAGSGKEERLAYLHRARAEALRASLLAAHHGLDPATPEPPELAVATVQGGRLATSVALTGSSAFLLAILIGLAVVFGVSERAGKALVAAAFVYLIGLVTGVWRRFSSQYGFTIATAPDGIRVRRGLLGRVAETIPARRVQAIRQIEPILWRPWHWRRLEVDLAGVGKRDTAGGSSSVVKTLLPVGEEALATTVRAMVVDDNGVTLTPPPPRARLKAPLSYHNLRAGHDEHVVMAVTGRLRRVTCWVPLEKVQSVRRVQGPLQRALHVATVHVDVAGRRVDARFEDRDEHEADRLVAELAELSRAARTQLDGPPGASRTA
jgi:putative membrane protein